MDSAKAGRREGIGWVGGSRGVWKEESEAVGVPEREVMGDDMVLDERETGRAGRRGYMSGRRLGMW